MLESVREIREHVKVRIWRLDRFFLGKRPPKDLSQLSFDAANALASVHVNSMTSVVYMWCRWYTQSFTEILHNPCHVLQALLTPPADHNCNLRDRPHNRQLPDRMSLLTNCNFIVRMLFCDSYWLYWLYSLFIILHFILFTIAVWQ